MTSNHTIVRDPDSDFSFGVRELRQANASGEAQRELRAGEDGERAARRRSVQHLRQFRPQEELGAVGKR